MEKEKAMKIDKDARASERDRSRGRVRPRKKELFAGTSGISKRRDDADDVADGDLVHAAHGASTPNLSVSPGKGSVKIPRLRRSATTTRGLREPPLSAWDEMRKEVEAIGQGAPSLDDAVEQWRRLQKRASLFLDCGAHTLPALVTVVVSMLARADLHLRMRERTEDDEERVLELCRACLDIVEGALCVLIGDNREEITAGRIKNKGTDHAADDTAEGATPDGQGTTEEGGSAEAASRHSSEEMKELYVEWNEQAGRTVVNLSAAAVQQCMGSKKVIRLLWLVRAEVQEVVAKYFGDENELRLALNWYTSMAHSLSRAGERDRSSRLRNMCAAILSWCFIGRKHILVLSSQVTKDDVALARTLSGQLDTMDQLCEVARTHLRTVASPLADALQAERLAKKEDPLSMIAVKEQQMELLGLLSELVSVRTRVGLVKGTGDSKSMIRKTSKLNTQLVELRATVRQSSAEQDSTTTKMWKNLEPLCAAMLSFYPSGDGDGE